MKNNTGVDILTKELDKTKEAAESMRKRYNEEKRHLDGIRNNLITLEKRVEEIQSALKAMAKGGIK